jgi:type I restriction enzyme M protein
MVTRTLKEFSSDEINEISEIYHSWRGTNEQVYKDIAGFCKAVKLEEVKKYEYILTPGRYVEHELEKEDGEAFELKMERITGELSEQFVKSKKLEVEIRKAMEEIGYGI